jgi:hypothetical protein
MAYLTTRPNKKNETNFKEEEKGKKKEKWTLSSVILVI